MADRSEDRDFLRFRDKGDPEALARVFDGTAPRLLLLAGHLTRDAAQAEDLLQTTFLHAMRDAASYDGSRPVSGWLAGILNHRALDLKRRLAVRAAEPLGEEQDTKLDPAALAGDRELFQRVTDAIEELEDPYRQVLVLRVLHGLEPTAIAHALGRPPGTVRMQLKRGIERLRRAIPERSALLGALFVDPERGLSAIREAILTQAGTAAAVTAGGGVLGGLLTMKAIAIGAAAVTLVVALVAVNRDGNRSVEEAAPVGGEQLVTRELDEPSQELSAPEDHASTDRETVDTSTPSTAAGSDGFDVLVRFEADGAPAVDVGIYVRAGETGELGVELRTDAQGRALLGHLAPGAYDAHVDRLRAPTAFAMPLEQTLEIWIPRGVQVEGLVVDLEGNGVAGASVLRFNEQHHDLLQMAARTDAEGRFRLQDAMPGTDFVARAARFQPSEVETVRDRGAAVSALILKLGARGHVLRGQVTHRGGTPAPYAWVAIGVDEDAREELEGSTRVPDDGSSRKNMDREAFFVRADAEGRFETDEVPGGHTIVIARPREHGLDQIGWVSLWVRDGQLEEVAVVLTGGAEITGFVRDDHGLAVAGLELEAEWEGTPLLGQMEDDLGPWMSDRHVFSEADGSYRMGGLLPGDYDLRVLGSRDELAREERILEAGTPVQWNPVIDSLGTILVRLLDPAGSPLEGWVISASERAGERSEYSLFSRSTDAQGRRRLDQMKAEIAHQVSVFAPSGEGTFQRMPVATRDNVVPSSDELVIRLQPAEMPTGTLGGRVLDELGEPVAGLRLELGRDNWEDGSRLRTDDSGGFTFEDLAAGTYQLACDGDSQPREASLGEWTLSSGEERDIGVLALPGAGRLVIELVAGDGGKMTNAEIELEARDQRGQRVSVSWERQGNRWSSSRLRPGDYDLRVSGDDFAPHTEVVHITTAPETFVRVVRERGELTTLLVALPPEDTGPARARLKIWNSGGVLVVDDRLEMSFSPKIERVANLMVHLAPGSYRAEIEDQDHDLVRDVRFQVSADGDTEAIEIELRP